jgi:hypothetical protein
MNEDLKNKDSVEDRMDDLFRKAMEGHRVEPDPVLWKGISRKLLWLEIKRFNFSNFTIKQWSTTILTVMLTGLAVYFSLPDMSQTMDVAKNTNPSYASNEAQVLPTSSNPATNTRLAVSGNKIEPVPGQNQGKLQPNDQIVTTGQVNAHPKSLAHQFSEPAKSETSSEVTPFVAEDPNVPDNHLSDPLVSPPPVQIMLPSITAIKPFRIDKIEQKPGFDTIITIRTIRGDEKFAIKRSAKTQMFSVSFGINPEWAFYRGAENYTKMNYWAQGGVSYHYSRFSVTSGVGLGYMLDNGKYKVDYKSEDSIGFFSNVVSYTVGVNNEIVFNSKDQTIYDSLLHQDDYRTSDRYTYLRIPLLFGYRVFESDNFNVSIQAGPAISFLLGERKSDPVIEYTNARIIRIDEETPARMKTNWQLWANLMVEMRITRKIGIYLEPSFKYYMKPTAEQENSEARPPWSLGLGIGLQFNFEQKK